MKCPVCNVELNLSERQGVEIDYCPQCRGVWLDRGELDKLIERSAAATLPARDNYTSNSGYYKGDDDDHRHPPQHGTPYPPKKKSFLGEVFDIFD